MSVGISTLEKGIAKLETKAFKPDAEAILFATNTVEDDDGNLIDLHARGSDLHCNLLKLVADLTILQDRLQETFRIRRG